MNGETLVVDASVAIKWVIAETGTEQALSLRRRRITAPDLLIPEGANILWKKARRGELSEAEAILAARLLQRADVQLADAAVARTGDAARHRARIRPMTASIWRSPRCGPARS